MTAAELKEQKPSWKDNLPYCFCGKRLSGMNYKFCSEHRGTNMKGSNNPNWKGGYWENLPRCEICSVQLSQYGLTRCKRHIIVKDKTRKRLSLAMEKRIKDDLPVNQFGKYKGGRQNKLMLNRKRRMLKENIPGTHSLKEWEELKQRYNFMCLCCKRHEPEIVLSEDHIVPISQGGTDDISNIQPLCRSCNSRKGVKIINFTTNCFFILNPKKS